PHHLLLSAKNGIIPSIIQANLPKTRGIDQVPLSIETPWEEEVTLANLNPVSYFTTLYFPQDLDEEFRRSILLENITDAERDSFEKAYRLIVQKLSVLYEGKPLVLKNPPSTARLLFLKNLFPTAKFIHIVRNPFDVFASSVARFPKVWSFFSWQDFADLDPESIVLRNYRCLMNAYLEQAPKLPAEDLAEVRFEDLEENPLREIQRLADQLDLPGFEEGVPSAIGSYVDSQKTYQKNLHSLTPGQEARIEQEWGFALERWNYQIPKRLQATAHSA
ncbi:MAG: sulfotransferase, partial [Verrucomicrobiota bacterium]